MISKEEELAIYEESWLQGGQTNQVYQLAEECSELTHAAHRFNRKPTGLTERNKLAEEIGDVQNCINQCILKLDIAGLVDCYRERKMLRLEGRLIRKAKALAAAHPSGSP